jgi:hypothetical protein
MDCINHITLWRNLAQATKVLENGEAKVEVLSRNAKCNSFKVVCAVCKANLCAVRKANLWSFDNFLLLAKRI